jgi:nicotinate-nucleotide adenylyltransferase
MITKIALLGGSFNPPHQGHLYLSKQVVKKFKLQQIWWLPTKQNPLKDLKNPAFNKRFKQCQEVVKNHRQIKIKNHEQRIKSCLTIDLLKTLQGKYPNIKFYFIIGADNLAQFHLWDFWQDIIKKINLIVINREDFLHKSVRSKGWVFARKFGSRFLYMKKCNISSTQIRNNKLKYVAISTRNS